MFNVLIGPGGGSAVLCGGRRGLGGLRVRVAAAMRLAAKPPVDAEVTQVRENRATTLAILPIVDGGAAASTQVVVLTHQSVAGVVVGLVAGTLGVVVLRLDGGKRSPKLAVLGLNLRHGQERGVLGKTGRILKKFIMIRFQK